MPNVQNPKLKVRFDFEDTYPGTWQPQGVGAQAVPYKRGWYPQLPSTDSTTALALCRVKKWLYIGGEFQVIGGVTRAALGRMDLETGEVDASFNAQLAAAGAVRVNDIATDGENVYIAGAWDTVGGVARPYLAKLDRDGNLVQDFNATADNVVTKLEYRTGSSTLYALGIFGAIGGEARSKMAEISTQNGFATAFNAGAFGGSADPLDLAYSLTDDTVYVVGNFTSVNGGTARGYGAKLNGSTGTAAAWNPAANTYIKAVVVAYPLVYLGGIFTNIGGSARNYVAALNQAAAATSFAPTASDPVNCIALDSFNSRLYFGGDAGMAVACDLDGVTLPWTPGFDAADTLVAVLAYKSTTFWVGTISSFNGIGSTTVTQDGAATVPFPLFRDNNTIFVKQSDSLFEDAGAGTYADPKRTIAGANGTSPSYNDAGGTSNHLTQTGTVRHHFGGFPGRIKGEWCAGLFDDSNYLNIPSAVGTAWAASNALTMQMAFYVRDLATVNTLFDWQNATGDVVVQVETTGAVTFNIHGTSDSSATGLVEIDKWYVLYVEKNPSGNLKRMWLGKPGQTPLRPILSTTQAATFGANTSNRLGKRRTTASVYLTGFLGPVFAKDDASVAITDDPVPLTWRDAGDADNFGYWPMQTKSVLEAATGNYYVCILDSETYEEEITWHAAGCSLYANDGCSPVLRPRIGAKPGTYGARVSGREKFSTGAGSTFLYVSKTGDDATGTRGNQALPFETIAAAIAAASASDTIQIEDSGVYEESLNAGSALTLQAADGEVPTLQQPISTTALLTGRLSIYGLILRSQFSAAAGTYTPTVGVALWDCTLIETKLTVATNAFTIQGCVFRGLSEVIASGTSVLINNCAFFDTSDVSVSSVVTVRNCSFSLTAGTGGVAAGYSLGAGGTPDLIVDRCYFTLANFKLGAQFPGAATGRIEVRRCVVDATATAGTSATGAVFLSSGFTTINDCLIFGATTTIEAFQGSGPLVRNCAAIGMAGHGFSLTAGGHLLNSVAANCGTGFELTGATPMIALAGLLTVGCTTGILAAASQTPTYSTFDVVGANIATTGAGYRVGEAGFLSSVVGDENLALSAVSPGLFNGDGLGVLDQGLNWAWSMNQVVGAVINGLSFEGNFNMGAGMDSIPGIGTVLQFCTFDGLGIAGYLMRDGADAYACEGAETNGPAFRVGGVSASVTRSVAWGCAGAAFVFGAPDYLDEHNSSWGCEYGHYDASGAVGTIIDSIHTGNGVDVVASGEPTYSAIGSIGDITELGTGVTRLDPLYQDPFTGDLGIQTLQEAYAFASPARGTASDGTDMGAMETEYGALTALFAELDFGAYDGRSADDGGPWTNPDEIVHEKVPIKLAEGDKPSGGSYSAAKAYKSRWTMRWGTSNPMPLDQRIALTEVFADNGQVAVAGLPPNLDDCQFIPGTVLKSNALSDTEIGGAYTSNSVDRPVGSIVFQES